LQEKKVDVLASHPDRHILHLELLEDDRVSDTDGDTNRERTDHLDLSRAEFERRHGSVPARVGEIGPLLEDAESFFLQVLLSEDSTHAEIASYVFPKMTWDD